MPASPIETLGMLMISQGHDPKIVSGLLKALRDPHDWKECAADAEHQMKAWETETNGWNIKVFDYWIGNQPNQKAGAHGQLVAMASRTEPLVLMSDGLLFQQIGALLFKEISTASFRGSGNLPSKDQIGKMIAHHKFKQGEADLRDPAQLKLVVHWLRDLIDARDTDPCGWGIPRSGAEFRIYKAEKRVVVVKGEMDMPTRISFYALGYRTENDPHSDHDDMMCQLWSSLYEP